MTNSITDTSQRKAVRVAGFMFLFSLMVPFFNWTFVLSKLIVAENVMATANNIVANQLLFRIGMTIELIMSAGLIVLALALYIILKPVNKNLALLALLWKLVEATIAAAIVLVSFIALQFLNGDAYVTVFTPEQLQVLVGFLLNEHTALYSIPMVFLGLDMMVFSYLFFKSKYIPRILASFGILSFALIFIHALMYILAPEYATMPINQVLFWVPSGLFEIIIGLWLLFKGINVQQGDDYIEEAA
ncbi:DUF4386 domain-containing protein [Methanococcoides seepicolus]|uniref:DUF4386 domain-containing protein n=1 Tax=Methanococcoides seepicolus TaxID=2828780 RepID=A0A9E5DBG6_9EURY|nr:DUF4386 domain-containing protein [Methanococcoides seepicolus]MCM1986892.1 DUF4386 domain-containing protein [Methanococcoides seepicolus]